jgi:uncharacterized protein (DUF1810 family)
MQDSHNLQRFVDAQAPVFDRVLAELRQGQKQSHWMWFVFPQISGLGRSETARHFALSGLDEARAYLQHPLLGPRLEQCAQIIAPQTHRSARQLFGTPDDLKLHSSMTLFAVAAPDKPVFEAVLAAFFNAERDSATLKQLNLQQL